MKKILMTALLPAILLGGATLVQAHDHGDDKDHKGKHHHKHKKSGMHDLFASLALSDAQKADIKTLMKQHHSDKRDAMKSRWQLRKQMMQLSYSDEVDQQRLDELIAASTEMHADHLADKAELQQAIYQLLDADQQQQLQQQLAEKR